MKYLSDISKEFTQKLREKVEVLYDLKRSVNIHSDKDTEKYVEGIIVGLTIARDTIDFLEGCLAEEYPDIWIAPFVAKNPQD